MTLFIIMIAYLIGIIWGLYINNIASIFLIIIILFISVYSKKIKAYVQDNKKVIILLIIIFAISFVNIKILENSYTNKYKNINENVTIKAIVVSNTIEKQYKNIYTIKVESINNKKSFKGDLLRLQIKNKKSVLNYGDEIEFQGDFESPQTARNTKGFNYKEYLKTKKIYGIVNTNSVEILNQKKCSRLLILINNLKLKIESRIDEVLNEDEANLLKGFLIGDKDNLNTEIQQDFRESSLSHLLAVSGTHVSYVILGITMFWNLIKTHKKNNKVITIVILIIFMLLTGGTPSVVRACVMAIYIIVGSLIYRKPNTINSISLALLIIMLSNPYSIFDIGLQLSFGGTIGIVLFNKKIEKLINRNEQQKDIKNKKTEQIRNLLTKILNYIKAIAIVSLSANIVIIPIMLYHYNTLSLTFIISNILAAPLLAIIIIFGFIAVFISFLSINLAKFILVFISIVLKILIQITKITSKIPFSKIYLPTPSVFLLILYYCFLVFIIVRKINIIEEFKNKRELIIRLLLNKKIIAITLSIVLIVSIIKVIPKDLEIDFIDVGQGDSTLIITPMNKKILIDGGGAENSGGYDIGKNVVIPYLLDKGIAKLDYIIISHFDSDHVGRSFKYTSRTKSWTSYNIKTRKRV